MLHVFGEYDTGLVSLFAIIQSYCSCQRLALLVISQIEVETKNGNWDRA